jgi:single-stranded-DNA-specific exonuclease
MYRPRRWNLAPADPVAASLAADLRVSPYLGQMLLNRGLREAAACREFLRPTLAGLHPPEALAGVTRAAERLARAVRDGEKVVIYGDYDVDGITATCILWHAIRVLGGRAEFYIPHRIDEGYGLNAEALKAICDEGASVIVSVDCGVTAVEQARVACERGVDLIVTDHHEWKCGGQDDATVPLLPECYAVVHPRLQADGAAPYPNPVLCGAGVAFKLAWGLGKAITGGAKVAEPFKNFLLDATALVALGTIADVVPLVGENRILAQKGLLGLRQSKLVGLRALIASAGLTDQALDSYDVGFKLAPRLNAIGRLGHARLAVEMLTTDDEKKATEIATYLEGQNRQRQSIERKIVQQAVEQVTNLGLDDDGSCAIVVGHEEWHAGVVGIVASRLVDQFHRPAVVVALKNGHGQGSGRSIAGFHLNNALAACAEHLETFGGHEMAAGLKLQSEKFEMFRDSFNKHASSVLTPEMLVPELRLECLAELSDVSETLVGELKWLGPFGHGNPKPLLCCRGVELATLPRRVGQSGDHLQLLVRQGERTMKCIAFGYGPLFDRLTPGTKLDLAVEPTLNEYNGYRSVELEVKDLQFTGA